MNRSLKNIAVLLLSFCVAYQIWSLIYFLTLHREAARESKSNELPFVDVTSMTDMERSPNDDTDKFHHYFPTKETCSILCLSHLFRDPPSIKHGKRVTHCECPTLHDQCLQDSVTSGQEPNLLMDDRYGYERFGMRKKYGLSLLNIDNFDYTNTPVSDKRWSSLKRSRTHHDNKYSNCFNSSSLTIPISVITTFYAREDSAKQFKMNLLRETAKSLQRQTWKCFEWIIVNDGSIETYHDELDDFISSISQDFHVKYYSLKKNIGLPGARNFGIGSSNSNSMYLVFLDDDDLLEDTFIEKCFLFLESNTKYGYVNTYSVAFEFMNYVHLMSFQKDVYSIYNNQYMTHQNIFPVTAMYRKSVLLHPKIRGFDETLIEGMEDWDLHVKLLYNGFMAHTIPELLFWYRIHPPDYRWKHDSTDHGKQKITKEFFLDNVLKKRYPELYSSQNSNILQWLKKKQNPLSIKQFPWIEKALNTRSIPSVVPGKCKSRNVMLLLPRLSKNAHTQAMYYLMDFIDGENIVDDITIITFHNQDSRDYVPYFQAITTHIFHLPFLSEDAGNYQSFSIILESLFFSKRPHTLLIHMNEEQSISENIRMFTENVLENLITLAGRMDIHTELIISNQLHLPISMILNKISTIIAFSEGIEKFCCGKHPNKTTTIFPLFFNPFIFRRNNFQISDDTSIAQVLIDTHLPKEVTDGSQVVISYFQEDWKDVTGLKLAMEGIIKLVDAFGSQPFQILVWLSSQTQNLSPEEAEIISQIQVMKNVMVFAKDDKREEGMLKRIAKRMGYSGGGLTNMEWVKFEHKMKILSFSDFILVPLPGSSCMTFVLQAMSLECAIISLQPWGDLTEIVKSGKEGYILKGVNEIPKHFPLSVEQSKTIGTAARNTILRVYPGSKKNNK